MRIAIAIILVVGGCFWVGRLYGQEGDSEAITPNSALAKTSNGINIHTDVKAIVDSDTDPSSTAKPTAHIVKLSWKASIPATTAAGDAIIGYIVYRGRKPQDRKALPINVMQITGTTFVDTRVEPGAVYYYVTRAVSASGKVSGPSNEVRVEIPR